MDFPLLQISFPSFASKAYKTAGDEAGPVFNANTTPLTMIGAEGVPRSPAVQACSKDNLATSPVSLKASMFPLPLVAGIRRKRFLFASSQVARAEGDQLLEELVAGETANADL